MGDEREAEEYTVLSYNRVKPWSTKEIIYADDYWKYARHSAGYEEVLREYFSYKLAKPIPEPKKPDDEPRGVQTLRVLTWPFRMTVAFFRSMRRYGVSVTLSSVKRKLRFAFGKLFCGGKK